MVMENSYDFHHFVTNFEVNRIWKPMKQSPANAIFDFRKLKRCLCYTLHDCVKLHQEFRTKSTPLFFVPGDRIDNVKISFVP